MTAACAKVKTNSILETFIARKIKHLTLTPIPKVYYTEVGSLFVLKLWFNIPKIVGNEGNVVCFIAKAV